MNDDLAFRAAASTPAGAAEPWYVIEARLRKDGGPWLAQARTWMQSNVKGGDRLTWGSGDPVSLPFFKLEELALRSAAAALSTYPAATSAERQACRDHHAALQQIGTALGLLPGSDLHRDCVPEIARLRAAAAPVSASTPSAPDEPLWRVAQMAWLETAEKNESIRDAWQRVADRIVAAATPPAAPAAPVGQAEPTGMRELLENFSEWARQIAARDGLPRGIRSMAACLHDDAKRMLATPKAARPAAQRAQPAEPSEDAKDAARWRHHRTRRGLTMMISYFGNGCVNRAVEDVEALIDSEIAAARAAQGASPSSGAEVSKP